jgi:hypothetical protein
MAPLLVYVLALVSEEPFLSIRKAEVSFYALERNFVKYKKALDECSPQYDVSKSPGPPFDMYHNLEVLHRMLTNMTTWILETQSLWYDLKSDI